jgi:site-specific recombinase XerD
MPRTKRALIDWRDHLKWMRHRKKMTSMESNRVFCRLDGTPIKRFDKLWRCACKEAGIEGLRFHDLRHTSRSNLLLAGSDLKDVKEMIGHNDLSMTDRYSHLTLRHKQIQQAKLAEHYANADREASGLHIGYTNS